MEAAKVSVDAFREALQGRFAELTREVAKAVNDAKDGAWIDGSEVQVRDLLAEFRRVVFETAVQMRTDAAASAFPPSAGPDDRPADAQQGRPVAPLADAERTDRAVPAAIPRPRRLRRAGRRPA
jgi:hypothetical protein